MEAIWSRFLPAYRPLVDVIAEGRIGEPLLVEADFGFRRPVDPDHRHFASTSVAGRCSTSGSIRCSCAPWCSVPSSMWRPTAWWARPGIDESVAALLRHPGDGWAWSRPRFRVGMTCTARIAGTDGVIEIPALMHCPELAHGDGSGRRRGIDASYEGNGLRFEIDEVHRCLEGRDREPGDVTGRALALAGSSTGSGRRSGWSFPGSDISRGGGIERHRAGARGIDDRW